MPSDPFLPFFCADTLTPAAPDFFARKIASRRAKARRYPVFTCGTTGLLESQTVAPPTITAKPMVIQNPNLRGALFMMAAMAAFTFNDTCMKALSDELPLFQAVFMRGIATVVLMGAGAILFGGLKFDLQRRDWALIGLRTAAEVAAAYFFVTALFNMPIANATAILQALPLSITLAGAVFLGEAVGWRRLLAILLGFSGVLLIVQPGAAGFNSYSVYALLAVASVTVRDLSARRLSAEVPSMTVALVSAVVVAVVMGLGSITDTWVQPSGVAWLQLAGASVFIIGGYLFSVMTMRVGEIGAIAQYRYTSLIWALLLGLLIFGEWPDALTLLGAGIVVATGIFTLLRERRLNRRPSPRGLRTR